MKSLLRSLLCSIALIASTAFAGQVGTASVNDVTLGGEVADDFVYSSNLNPQGNAGSSGFEGQFSAYGTEAWEKLAKVSQVGNSYPLVHQNSFYLGKLFFTFTLADDKNGSWSVKSLDLTNNIVVDLVFAMHVGGGSGAWLFNDQVVLAGQTLQGTWTQNMVNGNNRRTGFSNLTIFGRVGEEGEIVEVPEPATLASLALGLGMLGVMRRRKFKQQ